MPDKKGRMTHQEKRFVDLYAATGDAVYSADKAGYAHPSKAAYNALARPEIQAAALAKTNDRLINDILPMAVKRHFELLSDARTPANVVANLIKLAYDKAGVGVGEDGKSKEPHEMSAEELATALAALKREASDRARPIIDAEPVKQGVFD